MIDESLPGADTVRQGIHDLEKGVESVPALLVSIASSALRDVGVAVPARTIASPEFRLYELLSAEFGDGAHSKYNSWTRRLTSFLRAARCVR
ncbi:MAG: hypothetical protein HYR85_22425 [Planctomycetes bacterium]|nr:hypothetical protein [Planctomycetota bacterium]MBI3844133.1 hypothetical protein [Planctomycetota bacterium]